VAGPGDEHDHDRADHREMGDCSVGVEFVTKDSTAVAVEIGGEIYGEEFELVSGVTQDVGCFLRR